MNKNILVTILFVLILNSCASIEESNTIIKKDLIIQINENEKFTQYLEYDWEETLINNPLFASYTGDKRFNDKINPITIDQFNKDRDKDLESLAKLNNINRENLTEDNNVIYNLKKFDIESDLNLSQFPIYYLRLNQRGGIQSFYETGNRLVYQSKKDYYDWLSRLDQFSENILTFLDINKQGLKKGYTQPKLVTRGVVAQIDAIINSDIESNPYLKVFLEADENLLTPIEKEELIDRAKTLIINEINPAYEELNNFLKNDYLVNSRDSIGIKDIPDGKRYYEELAKHFTTTDLTPDEIHDIGLKEIERIRSEMEEIIESVDWDGDFNSFLNYLRTSPRFYYDNPDDLFDAYLIMSKTIDPLLPKLFNVFPRAPYGVIPIPSESAPFTTTALSLIHI